MMSDAHCSSLARSHAFISDPLSCQTAAVIYVDLLPDLPDGSSGGRALRYLVDAFLQMRLPGLRKLPSVSCTPMQFLLRSAGRDDIGLQLTPHAPEALVFRQAVFELSEARPPSTDSFLLMAHRLLEQAYQAAGRTDEYKAIVDRLVAEAGKRTLQ